MDFVLAEASPGLAKEEGKDDRDNEVTSGPKCEGEIHVGLIYENERHEYFVAKVWRTDSVSSSGKELIPKLRIGIGQSAALLGLEGSNIRFDGNHKSCHWMTYEKEIRISSRIKAVKADQDRR